MALNAGSSLMDTARSNIIARLVTDGVLANTNAGVPLSDADLMRTLRADGLQNVWTFTGSNDAVNFWQYCVSIKP